MIEFPRTWNEWSLARRVYSRREVRYLTETGQDRQSAANSRRSRAGIVKDATASRLMQERLAAVEARLQAACQRAGRARSEVTLVAVTKTITPAWAALLPELGVLDLGENRPQELWHKAQALPRTVRWHLIGHLQRNKIERTLPLVTLIHSVDSLRLLQALEEAAAKQGKVLPVLLEVNASREASKGGLPPEEVPGLVPQLRALTHVQVHGLMTMAAYDSDPEQCRPTFQEVRQLRDTLRQQLEPPHVCTQLSMGMTNDYEVAVEEGATLVRIGSALFEDLPTAPD
jgi:pyridoxal phosphate enzyme (YggS family)